MPTLRHCLMFQLLIAATPVLADSASNGLDTQITAIAQPLLKAQDLPGLAVGISAPSGIRRLYYFGSADRLAGQLVDADTLFEIGSLSKTYAATLGAYAAVTGQLRLDETAGQVRPALAGTPVGQATLLQLATYSAVGLPLQFPEAITTAVQADTFYRDFQPAFPAGSQRVYSNPSIGLFGALVAQRLGKPYADALQQHVLTPLGLQHTFLEVPDASKAHYAWGLGKGGERLRVNPGVYAEEAYGIKTTASDLLAFVEFSMAPERAPGHVAQALRVTHTGYYRSGPMTQGLGWEAYDYPLSREGLLAGNASTMVLQPQPVEWLQPPQTDIGTRAFNKTGSTNGFGAYALFVPDRKIGVVILANRNFPIPARVEAAYQILQRLETLPAH